MNLRRPKKRHQRKTSRPKRNLFGQTGLAASSPLRWVRLKRILLAIDTRCAAYSIRAQ